MTMKLRSRIRVNSLKYGNKNDEKDSMPLLSKIILEEDEEESSLPSLQAFTSSTSTINSDESDDHLSEANPNISHERQSQFHLISDTNSVTSDTDVNITNLLGDSYCCEDTTGDENCDASTLASMSDWTNGSALHAGCPGPSSSVGSFDEVSAIYSYHSASRLSSVDLSTIRSNYSESVWNEDLHRKRLGGHQGIAPVMVTTPRPENETAEESVEPHRMPLPNKAAEHSDTTKTPTNHPRGLIRSLFGCLWRPCAMSPIQSSPSSKVDDSVLEVSSSCVANTHRQWV